MAEEPFVRGSIPKSSWAEIERSSPATREQILKVLGAPFAAELDKALSVTWVPFSIEARIADAVYEALGPAGARSFYRDKTAHSFEFSWLKPLIHSSLRLFGATPNSFLKMLPRTWSTLSRNCGTYSFEGEGERRGASIIDEFPTRLYRRKEAWIESLHGGYEGFFAPFRMRGSVESQEVDFAAGHVRFVLSW